jgi:hypothetical protein
MGHMELRHGMRAVGTEKILKLFSMLKELGNGDGQNVLADQVKALVDEVFEKMFTSVRNGYGIEMESQADWRSLQLSAALGYDSKALYDVLERFKAVKVLTEARVIHPNEVRMFLSIAINLVMPRRRLRVVVFVLYATRRRSGSSLIKRVFYVRKQSYSSQFRSDQCQRRSNQGERRGNQGERRGYWTADGVSA